MAGINAKIIQNVLAEMMHLRMRSAGYKGGGVFPHVTPLQIRPPRILQQIGFARTLH